MLIFRWLTKNTRITELNFQKWPSEQSSISSPGSCCSLPWLGSHLLAPRSLHLCCDLCQQIRYHASQYPQSWNQTLGVLGQLLQKSTKHLHNYICLVMVTLSFWSCMGVSAWKKRGHLWNPSGRDYSKYSIYLSSPYHTTRHDAWVSSSKNLQPGNWHF